MGKPSGGEAPDYAKLMELGYSLAKKYAEPYARQEYKLRKEFDPKLIAEQQGLQQRFGPTQYRQQLAALQQLDPLGYGLRQQFGQNIQRDLTRGFIDPQQAQAYRMLGTNVTGDLARRYALPPDLARELEQGIRARQTLTRGESVGGNADVSAEALYKGQRAQQLYQQRLGNAQSFYNLQSPRAQTYAQAGGFLGSGGPRSPVDLVQGIQGVQAPRGFSYINPAAGQQAAQFGLANYPNQVANQGQNPWASALGGAAAGAQAGTMISPGYGTAIGAVVGGVGGYLGSDARLKHSIVDTGERTLDGIPIVEFRYNHEPKTRYRGVLAQDVVLVKPEAVFPLGIGDYLGVDYNALGLKMERIE